MGRSRDREGSLSSTGSGRTSRSKKWDGEGGHRLHLSDLPVGISKHEIEKLFRPYGELNEIWVATNPPCFAFINFSRRSDGERALKELDGTSIAGTRVSLTWARPRHYGGRSRNRSPSPSYRRNDRDSYRSSRYRRNSRSRSRSPYARRSDGNRRPSPRDSHRDDRNRTSKRDERKRRRRSSSGSDRSPSRSPRRSSKKQSTRSPSNQRQRSATPNGNHQSIDTADDRRAETEVSGQDY